MTAPRPGQRERQHTALGIGRNQLDVLPRSKSSKAVRDGYLAVAGRAIVRWIISRNNVAGINIGKEEILPLGNTAGHNEACLDRLGASSDGQVQRLICRVRQQ